MFGGTQTYTDSKELITAITSSRREFLRATTGALIGGRKLFGLTSTPVRNQIKNRKVVVVTFGGGARDDETFAPDGQDNIPHLLSELVPQASFYSQVVNRGILGHYVATASLATGVYETFNNFAAVAPDHPTVFEYFRKDLRRPPTDAWVIAPSNGFNRIGESGDRSYGIGTGAMVILPKRLLATAVPDGHNAQFSSLLRDNYESGRLNPVVGGTGIQLEELARLLKLSVEGFVARAQTVTSADELSIYIARQLMRQLAPSLIWITLHDIDVAHCGTFSLYLKAIQRTDQLCGELWRLIQAEPEYAGRTNLFILPDFGRDSDESAGGNGFQHHRTGDVISRTTWMMALGPGIRENVIMERPVQSIDLVPTLGSLLGFDPRSAQGQPLTELLS